MIRDDQDATITQYRNTPHKFRDHLLRLAVSGDPSLQPYPQGRDPRSAHASVLEYNDLGRVLAGE